MSNTIIKPTVGRVLWFYPSQLTGEAGFVRHPDGGPYAAIIARVWNDAMVNLAVFDANGTIHSRTSVPLVQDGGCALEEGFCSWMPFQKGQAAKQDTAAAAAAAPLIGLPVRELSDLPAAIPAAHGNSPRVTAADIEASIAAEYSITADSALRNCPLVPGLEHITICVLVLKNGTKIVGVNEGPVSPENFSAGLGRQYAREAAIEQVWPLLGFQLRSELARKAKA